MRAACLVLLTFFAGAAVVHADPGELDRRLQAGEVPAALRKKVQPCVDRAVAFLVARQAKDGSFEEHGPQATPAARTTVTLWVALALRHAGTRPALVACDRAAAWLFDGGAPRSAELEARTVDVGLALMLLLGLPERRALVQPLATRLAEAMDPATGFWTARIDAAKGERGSLAASHVAFSGLLAARTAGATVPASVWRDHARGLLAARDARSRAWPLVLGGAAETDGTLLAIGSLGALAGLPTAPEGADGIPAGNLLEVLRDSHTAIGRDAGRALEDPLAHFSVIDEEDALVMPQGTPPFGVVGKESGTQRKLFAGDGAYARLFAVVRMSLLANLRTVDAYPKGKHIAGPGERKPTPVACYASASGWLLEHQRRDGGFASEANDPKAERSETDTALAVLTLTRALAAYNPVAPAPMDAVPRPAPKPAGSK